MAGDEGIFATTQQVQDKVGVNANATANAEAFINRFILQAENMINSTITFNFSDAYAGLNIDVKGILTTAASAWTAIRIINYDPSAMGTSEATLRLNVLQQEYDFAIAELKNKNTQDFMKNA